MIQKALRAGCALARMEDVAGQDTGEMERERRGCKMKDIKISQKSRKFVMLLACTLGVALILAGLLPDRSIVVAASQTEDFYIVDGEQIGRAHV